MKIAIVFEIIEMKEVVEDELAELRQHGGDIPLECLEQGSFVLNHLLKNIATKMLELVHARHLNQDVSISTEGAYYHLLMLLGFFGVDNDDVEEIEIMDDRASLRLILNLNNPIV